VKIHMMVRRTKEDIETAIRQIISEAITSDEIIDVFSAAV